MSAIQHARFHQVVDAAVGVRDEVVVLPGKGAHGDDPQGHADPERYHEILEVEREHVLNRNDRKTLDEEIQVPLEEEAEWDRTRGSRDALEEQRGPNASQVDSDVEYHQELEHE